MQDRFKTINYEETLKLQISLSEALPENHLARFVVDVVSQLDLSGIYARYSKAGGAAYPPQMLLGLLFYGYSTGVFSSRKIERATYESLPFRYIAANLHPDHDTIANFRAQFLPEIKELFVQILLLSETSKYLKVSNVSVDGTKIHADASKSKAVSYKRLGEIETKIRAEVEELIRRSEQPDSEPLPQKMNVDEEIQRRNLRLTELAKAKEVLAERARERDRLDAQEYERKKAAYEKKKAKGRRGGRPPTPPAQSGIREKDQYNFTDPTSRIVKNSNNKGFEQGYNAQVAVDQTSMLIVGYTLSNHANDAGELLPTLDSIPAEIGEVEGVAADTGYFSENNVQGVEERGIEPYIATGREEHGQSWEAHFGGEPEPPREGASIKEVMAYKLRTQTGKAIYRLRKCTVEPVYGIVKEVLGFRQFSLRGIEKVTGEWGLVCLSFNLKRLHSLKFAK